MTKSSLICACARPLHPCTEAPSKHSKFCMRVSVRCATLWVLPPLVCVRSFVDIVGESVSFLELCVGPPLLAWSKTTTVTHSHM